MPKATVREWFRPDPLLSAYLTKGWWRIELVSVPLIAVFSAGLQILFPKPFALTWFFVVMILVVSLQVGFLFAYFRIGRAAPAQSPLQIGMWAGLAAIVFLASIQYGFVLGSERTLQGAMTHKNLLAVMMIAFASATVAGLAYVVIGKLNAQQDALKLEKAHADADRERLAKRNTESELKLMQAQVEPHFLYNTLANLRYLTESGSPQALAMIDHLIDYLRLSLPNFRSAFTTLRDEIALANAYLAIMEIRMGGKLRSAVDIPNAILEMRLPPLILLTLIENAVKHGIGRAPQGGEIDISAIEQNEFIELRVTDNGAGLNQTAKESALNRQQHSGVGLANIRERLAMIYGTDATLSVTAREPKGVIASICIPRDTP
jgi:signal transduction histidine kinase